jgi:lipoprotein-anchoring transpeptidase ErfK/SrfK
MWARRVLGPFGMIIILVGLFWQGAQVAMATDQPEQTIRPAISAANSGTAEDVRDAQPELTISAGLPRPIEKPMFPFAAPQVGPIIKRAFSDDIERRTTAFIPKQLDNLTPIVFPKNEKKWIRVDLSEQITVAYEGNRPIRAFVISSGLSNTPTVEGEFRIRTKVKAQTMTGGEGAGYYSLPNVKWVQYFYQDYSFHGTYWHNDFGHPKSHGCLNMTNADAKWLFDWAGPTWDGKTVWFNSNAENPGTLVIVHE